MTNTPRTPYFNLCPQLKRSTKYYLGCSLLALAPIFSCAATITTTGKVQVSIPEPTWHFELKYGLLSSEKARLFSNEQNIALELKPLLQSENYQAAWKILKNINAKKSSPALLQAKAQVAMQLKRNKEAATAFNAALAKRPDLLPSHRALAAIYLDQNENALAREHLTQAILLGDQDPSLFAQVAYLHMQQNESFSAIAGFRQALFLSPQNTDYKQGLLWALTESGDLPAAKTLLRQMIEQDTDNPDLWLHLAQIELLSENEKKALSNMEVALRLGNQSANNLILCAQLHLSHGSPQQSVDLLSQAIAQKGSDNNGEEHYETIIEALSVLIVRESDVIPDRLIQQLDLHESTFKPEVQSRYLSLKGSQAKQRNTAISFYKKAIAIDASNGEALISLGNLLLEQNKLNQADMYFTRAASFDKHRQQAWLSSAQVAISLGNLNHAIKLLRKTYKHYPDRTDLVTNIRQLEQLQKTI